MVERYFKSPVLIDYLLSILITVILRHLYLTDAISLPEKDLSISMTTDLATISLTFAGFILTLLTILITFKVGAKIPTDENQDLIPLFDIFFASPLYYQTTTLLKNAVKSLIVIAMVGFLLKLILRTNDLRYLFFYNISTIIIVTLTLWRNLTILSLILKVQKSPQKRLNQ